MKGCYSHFHNEQIRGVLMFFFTHLSFFVEMGFQNHCHQTIPTLHSAQNKDVNAHVKQGTWATCKNLKIEHHWAKGREHPGQGTLGIQSHFTLDPLFI